MSKELTTRDRPIAFTAAATLTPRHHDILLTNRGAAGSVALTLPAGQKGLRIRARKVTAQTFTLARAGSDTILDASGGSVTSVAVDGALVLEHDGTAWLAETLGTTQLPDDSVTAAKVADGAIDAAAKLASGVVETAKIAAGAVTPPKMAFTGLKTVTFAGRNGVGAITVTGAAIGDRVIAVWKFGDVSDNLTTVDGAATAQPNVLFEAAVTVVNEIQQASATDLSDNKYMGLLLPAVA